MGGTWRSLLGINSFKTSKLESLLTLTLKRLVVLKNQHQSRRAHAQSDIAQFLSLGQRDNAIDCAENVIKEQNLFDLFSMVETHCKYLIERLPFLKHTKVCPEDLKESISSLIYIASTNGELPELLELKSMFAARYDHGFASVAAGGRNNSGVSAKIIELMSTQKLTPSIKLKIVRDVAEEQGISFDLQDDDCSSSSDTISMMTEEDVVIMEGTSQPHLQPDSPDPSSYYWHQNIPESTKIKGQFTDAVSVAEAAFESATFDAVAARAVDLSRSQSQGKCSGGQSSSSSPNVTNDLTRVDQNNASESETDLVRKNSTAQKGKNMVVSGIDDDKQKEKHELVLTNRRHVEYEQKKGGGLSAVEEDESFSVYSPASSKDDDPNSRFKRSVAGKTSFSVRTRRSRSDFGGFRIV